MPRKKRIDIQFNGKNLKDNLKRVSDDIHNTVALINTQLTTLNILFKKTQTIEVAEQITRLLETRANLISNRLELIEYQKYVLQNKKDFSDISDDSLVNEPETLIRLVPELPKRYYVYVHWNKMTKEPFYVGKGSGNRAYTGNRNIDWKTYVADIKYEYNIEIVKDDLDENAALNLESEIIIDLSKNHKLLNKLPIKLVREREQQNVSLCA